MNTNEPVSFLDMDEHGPVTPEDVIEEIEEEWNEINAEAYEGMEEPPSFFQALQDYYWNLFDDLHDSKGDAEYQPGVIERIVAVRRMFLPEAFGTRYKTAEERTAYKEQVAKYLLDILNAEINEEDVTDGVQVPEVY